MCTHAVVIARHQRALHVATQRHKISLIVPKTFPI